MVGLATRRSPSLNPLRNAMAIPSKPVQLANFRWKLTGAPGLPSALPKPYILREAGDQELEDALRVVQASYNLDPEWSGGGKHIDEVILPAVKRAFAHGANCLFALHGNRVIGASVFDPEAPDGVHLVTGPCVFIEYRNRGIGGALLGATLEALRARGLAEAVGRTRPGTPSAKFLCSKFGGEAVASPSAPKVAEETAAAA